MDSLTHVVLGACMGEVLLGKKIGKKAMLWGAIAANFPDIDVFFAPFFHPVDGLFVHRGITHSFFFIFLLAPLWGWLFTRLYPIASQEEKGKPYDWYIFFFVCLLSHPLLDSCTMYGTGVCEPFSKYRAEFTALFIVEPLYTLPMIVGSVMLLILKKDSIKRMFWAKFGLYSSTLFLLLAIGNKLYVEKIFSDSLHKQNIAYSDFITTPTPLNNILWNVVAKDSTGYWIGYYSHFDKTSDVAFSFIPRNDSLAGDLLQNEIVKKLMRFSMGYYCFTKQDNLLYINDVRFAFAGEFTTDAKDFVFSFGLKKDTALPYGVQVQRNSWRKERFAGFSKLITRIKGI